MIRSFPSTPTALRQVRAFIRERAGEAALYQGNREDLVLAVSEICANAVQHARGDRFVVSWSAGPREPTEVRVKDEGVFAADGMAGHGPTRGYGLPLVAALVDELSIARGTPSRPGTTVRVIKYRAPADTTLAGRR
jgi:anti-sigma regulatory factor (Ser/Thr protein kinase)